MDKLIINVALTGCVAPASTPNLPVTPEQVARDAMRCADLGATMFHVHARDEQGNPAWGSARYRPYVDAVRQAVPGAVVCVSTSGRHFKRLVERYTALNSGPDMCSLTLGSVDFLDGSTSENGRNTVEGLLEVARDLGVKPEFEAFDLSHVYRLYEYQEMFTHSYLNIFLHVMLPANAWMLKTLRQQMPGGTVWAGAGIGPYQWVVNRWAIELGGHVRVGMEDNLWMGEGERATNPLLVGRVVEYAEIHGREPATFEETRRMLGLKP